MKYSREWWRQHYANRKALFVTALGGCCKNCGTAEKLEFDHVDPTTKRDNFTALLRGNPAAEKELPKVQLLCQKCHRDKTGRAVHGSRTMYQRKKCRCLPCVAANAAYMKQYRANTRATQGMVCKTI